MKVYDLKCRIYFALFTNLEDKYMDSFKELVEVQNKIKIWIIIIILMSFIVVADFVFFFATGMGWVDEPFGDSPAGTLLFMALIFLPLIIIVVMVSRYIESKNDFMNRYNNLFYVKALENQENVTIKSIEVTDVKSDDFESRSTKRSRADHEYYVYCKQAYLSILADISDISLKLENVVRWRMNNEDLGFLYYFNVRTMRATSKDVELDCLFENTRRLPFNIYIYHKKFQKKDYINGVKMYSSLTTNNNIIDKEYCIKTIDADKAGKLVNDRIKELIEKIVNFKMPMCIIMEGDTIELKIKSNNFKNYPPLSKKLDYDIEMTRANHIVNTFYELVMELNNR